MPSKTKKGKAKNEASDEEIVYSGQALEIAAGWLGIKDVEAELKHEDSKQKLNSGAAVRRFNKHMGLGSKVPSKHQTGVAGVEQRLGRKVFMSSKNRTGAGKHDMNATNGKYYNSGSGGGGNRYSSQKEAQKEDSSDESEGRGAAVGKGMKRSGAGSMRADLLASGGSKRRKKKRNGGGGGFGGGLT